MRSAATMAVRASMRRKVGELRGIGGGAPVCQRFGTHRPFKRPVRWGCRAEISLAALLAHEVWPAKRREVSKADRLDGWGHRIDHRRCELRARLLSMADAWRGVARHGTARHGMTWRACVARRAPTGACCELTPARAADPRCGDGRSAARSSQVEQALVAMPVRSVLTMPTDLSAWLASRHHGWHRDTYGWRVLGRSRCPQALDPGHAPPRPATASNAGVEALAVDMERRGK